MADITMCSYLGCPLRGKCERATATPSKYQYYITNPSKIIKGKFECIMFLGKPEDYFFEQFKSIFNAQRHTNNEKEN